MSAVVQLIPFIITVLQIFSRSFNQLNERPIIVFHLNMVLNNGPKVHNSADHGSDRGPQNPNPKVKILPPQFPILLFQNQPIHYAKLSLTCEKLSFVETQSVQITTWRT